VKHSIGVTAAVMLCLIAASAQAADPDAADTLFGKAAVSQQMMSEMRGGTALSYQSAELSGPCNCGVGGTASVSGNAFEQAAGIITVIQNVGANMILQNSTVVTINIH
jgi:hypothetical protein